MSKSDGDGFIRPAAQLGVEPVELRAGLAGDAEPTESGRCHATRRGL